MDKWLAGVSDLDRIAMPHNTPAARTALVNAPAWVAGMSLASYPAGVPEGILNWRSDRGVVLYGPAGVGKTGLAVCVLRDLAANGYGSTFYWNMVTGPGVRAAVESGEVKPLPSPCWFESWSRLLSLHRRERWDEEGWFEHLEARVSALALDDVSVDAGTPYRESFMLRHIEWAQVPGRLLLLTLNDRPSEWVRVLGERVADRMQDPARFVVVPVLGKSLR